MTIDKMIEELETYKIILGGDTEIRIEVNNLDDNYVNTEVYGLEPFNEFLYIGGK